MLKVRCIKIAILHLVIHAASFRTVEERRVGGCGSKEALAHAALVNNHHLGWMPLAFNR